MHRKAIAIVVSGLTVVVVLLTSAAYGDQGDALVEAARKGDLKQVQDLLNQGVNPDSRDKYGSTAIAAAAYQGDSRKDVIELLLNEGADPVVGLNSVSAIYERSLQPPHDEIVKLLIHEVANVNVRLRGGYPNDETLLIWAIGRVPTDVIRLIIDKDPDVNAGDDSGHTALMKAVSRGEDEIAMLLLEKGANVNARTKKGWTALMGAGARLGIVKALLDKGADVNAKDNCGFTPLMGAAERSGGRDVVKLMLENGADINARDICGRSVLAHALGNRDSEVLKLILWTKVLRWWKRF